MYKKYLGDYAKELPGSALLFPLSVKLPGKETPLVRTSLQLSLGPREYARLKTDLIDRSIEITMGPVCDPALNASRAQKIFQMFRDRIRELTPKEFQNLLRPAFQEDEWILIVLGGVTGFFAGLIHLFVAFL